MIDHLGLSRMAVLLVVALVIFGPEKLPEIASQIGKTIRKFRGVVDSLGSELRASVGPEIAGLDLKSLHPRAFMSDLLADDVDARPAALAVVPAAVVLTKDAATAAPASSAAPVGDHTPESPTTAQLAFTPEPDAWAMMPHGSDAMTLLHNDLDLSTVDAELAALEHTTATPADS